MRPNQIKHDVTERQARHITGVERKTLGVEMLNCAPSSLRSS